MPGSANSALALHTSRRGPALGIRSAAFLLLVFIGCDDPRRPQASAVPEGALVVVIGPYQAHPEWKGIRGGAERYGATRPNVSCVALAPSTDSPAERAALVDAALNKQPVAVCLYVDDPKEFAPLGERVVERGALLVTIQHRLPERLAYGHIEVAWPEAAELLARALAQLLPEATHRDGRVRIERSYVVFHRGAAGLGHELRWVRFAAAVPRQPYFTPLLEDDVSDVESPAAFQDRIRAALHEYPSAELIVTLDPAAWLCLQPRLELPRKSGASSDSAYVNRFATLGAAPRLWPRLESDEAVALVGPLDGDIGFAAVDLAVSGVMKIPDTPRLTTIRCEVVTRERLPDFARRYAEAANLDVGQLRPFSGDEALPSAGTAAEPGG